MKSMRKQLLGSVFFALLVLAGCKQPQTLGGIPRSKVYTTVISLSPSTSEMVGLAGSVKLAGRTKADNYPDTIPDAPIVADLKPDYEKITAIHPDLILYDRDLYSEADVLKMKQTHADVKAIGSDTVAGYIKEFYQLGNWIAGETNINEYIIKVQKQVAAAQGEKTPKPVKAVMIIPDSSGHHMISGVRSFQADIMKIIGATPVGPDSNKFEMLNPEFLVAQNPDVVLIAGKAKDFLADPRFANIEAVKSKHVLEFEPDQALRRGAQVDQFIYTVHKHLMLSLEGKL